MVCVPCIIIPALIWLYKNYLAKYLDPVLAPVLGPILKPIYAAIEPYVGKYINPPPAGSSGGTCPVSGKSSSDSDAKCPGESTSSAASPSSPRRRTKKAE
ncbi:Oidioi.mRNA.OKI2018_I69.PAR.g13154.t1.cds [Oikopleura dioica]|uniref:Oidioi.mRNA.OKI2018_I69.PAR.g13154.t1.cds n=1 Tax=Oikopleura dioica TaxID=34765 RepID=A0ABN7S6U5_OIKDI|nr:Oidioi.mRNA.OKI2018_I69.PAR.g13154.t1.cds [Oikopleura dioica]